MGKLRSIIARNKQCNMHFKQAENEARRIFNHKSKQYLPLPFYTEHGIEHSEKIEEYLDKIIFRNGNGRFTNKEFRPSPEEAMYLLSAAWMHDIGMWIGILDDDPPFDGNIDENKVDELRNKHERRSSIFINDKWDNDTWDKQEKICLSTICMYHRRVHKLEEFHLYQDKGKYDKNHPLRFNILSALLRLIDACHVDATRAPTGIYRLYSSVGMSDHAREHWKRAELIRDVCFDHSSRQIKLTGYYPKSLKYGLGEFNLHEVGEFICEEVLDELKTVQGILSQFENTCFKNVIHVPVYMAPLDEEVNQKCISLWPQLLNKPYSASRATASLSKLLDISIDESLKSGGLGEAWKQRVQQMISTSLNLRPHDFQIRNLAYNINKLLPDALNNEKGLRKFRGYLDKNILDIKKNCNKIAMNLKKVVSPKDAIFIYGCSAGLEMFLKGLDKKQVIYVVECFKPIDWPLRYDENKEISKFLEEQGFEDCRFIQFPSLTQTFMELKRLKKSCKVVMGTHSMMKNGHAICKAGCSMLASIARDCNVEIIVYADSSKYLNKGIKVSSVIGSSRILSLENCKQHPVFKNFKYITPSMDIIKKKMIDVMVSESHILKRKSARRKTKKT